MQQVIVGTKYQIVIPKEIRKKIKGIKPGAKVGVYLNAENRVTLKLNPQNWVEQTRGMMTKAWKNIDTTKYLDDLRNEWEERLQDLEKNSR